MCINMVVRKFGPFMYFPFKKGAYHIPGGAEKVGYSVRTSVLCNI